MRSPRCTNPVQGRFRTPLSQPRQAPDQHGSVQNDQRLLRGVQPSAGFTRSANLSDLTARRPFGCGWEAASPSGPEPAASAFAQLRLKRSLLVRESADRLTDHLTLGFCEPPCGIVQPADSRLVQSERDLDCHTTAILPYPSLKACRQHPSKVSENLMPTRAALK